MSNKLEIHERFKDARIVYNKNGKQTMGEVESATGIQKSMISSLEKDDTRGASFRDVAKLASHYGVSVDWLCGLTDVKSQKEDIKSINQATGLSESAINQLIMMKECSDSTVPLPFVIGHNVLMFFSSLISDAHIWAAVSFDVNRLICCENGELTESEKEFFVDSGEAIYYYQDKIRRTLESFIIRFGQSAKLEKGG